MASKVATKRLQKEYQMMMTNPPELIVAKPLESNILVWHYIITGPPDSPYTGGEYHGKVVFPEEYPYKPPAIKMLTPNGRFQTDTRLCLSMSDYHPATWNPAWSVATILTGLLSFMLEETPTTGSIKTSVLERRSFAARSKAWNRQDARFRDVWEDMLKAEDETAAANNLDSLTDSKSNKIPTIKTAERSELRKRVPGGVEAGAARQPQIQQGGVAGGHVAFVQTVANGVWAGVRSNVWILVLGGVMMYLVVLKVISRIG